mmetsp:Transcript_20663/g.31526  ORF Transcript_20663/g.31526 Transcript_20663/m.31526 type:complete len:96 (+) Transcript_20663:2502-2789(+)
MSQHLLHSKSPPTDSFQGRVLVGSVQDSSVQQEPSQEAVNNFSSPLLTKEEKNKELNNGMSFNSKKMAVAPMFFNLRIMCDCLGRAVRRHIDFSS